MVGKWKIRQADRERLEPLAGLEERLHPEWSERREAAGDLPRELVEHDRRFVWDNVAWWRKAA